MTGDLLGASDDGPVSRLVLLDLSAAFGPADHSILLQRAGLRGLFIREVPVIIPHTKAHGVPQGPGLGPLPFHLYIKTGFSSRRKCSMLSL